MPLKNSSDQDKMVWQGPIYFNFQLDIGVSNLNHMDEFVRVTRLTRDRENEIPTYPAKCFEKIQIQNKNVTHISYLTKRQKVCVIFFSQQLIGFYLLLKLRQFKLNSVNWNSHKLIILVSYILYRFVISPLTHNIFSEISSQQINICLKSEIEGSTRKLKNITTLCRAIVLVPLLLTLSR